MDLAQMIEQAKRALAEKLAERKALTDQIAAMRSKAEAGDTSVTEEQVREALAKRTGLDAELDQRQARVTELEAEKAADDAADQLSRQVNPGAARPQHQERAHVTEPRTYSRDTERAGTYSFFVDAYRAEYKRDGAAQERLDRHQTECLVEREGTPRMIERATTTGSYAGLVVPQYLVDMAAPVLRFGRPLANICNGHELPETGMSLIVPRGTTGASTAIQATENAAVSNTDQVWANLTIPVVTVAGQQQISRQSLERGYSIDSLVYADLARAYAANIDNQVINGSGAAGQMLGIINTAGISAATLFGAAPSIANFSLKVAGQIAAVTSAGAGIWPKVIAMAPRRWGWATSLVDGSNRPVVLASATGPFNAMAAITNPGTLGADPDPITGVTFQGVHSSGLPVLTDLNIPQAVGTNSEDLVLVLDTQELHLWEDGDGMPRELRFEQTLGNQLTTTLVVYGYAAFTAGRYPGAVGKVGGLDSTATFGLVAPTF